MSAVNHQTPTAVGIDTGREAIDVCIPIAGNAKRWPVTTIKLDDTEWPQKLAELMPDNDATLVDCIEATGTDAMPIINLITKRWPLAKIYLVPGTTTAAERTHFSAAKSDKMDARALASLAARTAAGEIVRGLRLIKAQAEAELIRLRLLVNTDYRLIRNRTATINRLRAILHACWPSLTAGDELTRWKLTVRLAPHNPVETLFALREGNVDGVTLAAFKALHSEQRKAVMNLAMSLPRDIPLPEVLINAAVQLTWHLYDLEQQRVKTEQEVVALMDEHWAALKTIWRSIPLSNNMTVAALIVAGHGDPTKMARDTFVSMTGVNPRTVQSGKIDTTRQSRAGYRPAKNALHLQGRSLMAASSPIPWFQSEKHRHRKRPLAYVRTKLARLYWGVAMSGKPFNIAHHWTGEQR